MKSASPQSYSLLHTRTYTIFFVTHTLSLPHTQLWYPASLKAGERPRISGAGASKGDYVARYDGVGGRGDSMAG